MYAYVYTHIKMCYIHMDVHINVHTERHRGSEKWGSPKRSEGHSLHPSPLHITSCVSVCVSTFNSVWRKMGEEREAWTWVWEKLPMLLSLFQICAWKHISEFLLHWLSWPTAKLEKIDNINGHCENKTLTYFYSFLCHYQYIIFLMMSGMRN